MEKFEKSFENNNISYKDKLTETGVYPITHSLDQKLIILAAEAATKQLRLPEVHLKIERPGRRHGSFPEIAIQKQKKRPYFAKTFLDKSLQQKAVSLFNSIPSSTKRLYFEKDKLKSAINKQLSKIDVLNIDGLQLERLKLEN